MLRNSKGFSLVEVLIALIIMSVGMLGIAALYIEGLRSGQASVSRTTAVNLAADMADRIRSNPNVPATYQGVGPGANNNCVNGPAACTPIEVAQEDWFWWLQDVQGRKIQFVKLTPIDTNSEVASILLGIDVETRHIYKLIETGKNGTRTTITVNSFKTDQPLPKTLFTFDEKKYTDEGYYIIRN